MKRVGYVPLWTAAFLLTTLGVATAQTQPAPPIQNMPPGRMMSPGSGMPMMGGPARMGMMGMADHVEGRIAFLKAELRITEAQMPQWNAFSDTLRENARRMREMSSTMMQDGMGQVSAPDRLDRMEKMMTSMFEAIKATRAALAPLYAVLTDEQKKVADQLIHGPMGMGLM
ncbi:MAG: Spy/CpxP family protein refolding chaperone [Nitrospira sp.]